MSTSLLFDWYSFLPPDVMRRAYGGGGSELAWARADALSIVRFLEERNYTILYIDTWLPTEPGPTPLIDDWSSGGALSAQEFIATFQRLPAGMVASGLEPFFAIDAEPAG